MYLFLRIGPFVAAEYNFGFVVNVIVQVLFKSSVRISFWFKCQW